MKKIILFSALLRKDFGKTIRNAKVNPVCLPLCPHYGKIGSISKKTNGNLTEHERIDYGRALLSKKTNAAFSVAEKRQDRT